MGPHGYRLTCLGASRLVPAPHSLRTANYGPAGPMCQSGGSCVCRAVPWLAIGLHTVKCAAEACLAAAGLMYCEFGCRLASYGSLAALEHCATGVCPVVSGVKMGPSAYSQCRALRNRRIKKSGLKVLRLGAKKRQKWPDLCKVEPNLGKKRPFLARRALV